MASSTATRRSRSEALETTECRSVFHPAIRALLECLDGRPDVQVVFEAGGGHELWADLIVSSPSGSRQAVRLLTDF